MDLRSLLVIYQVSVSIHLFVEILVVKFSELCHVTRRLSIAVKLVPLFRNRVIASTMPEIAEVERARTILDQILVGQTIIDVESVPFTLDVC